MHDGAITMMKMKMMFTACYWNTYKHTHIRTHTLRQCMWNKNRFRIRQKKITGEGIQAVGLSDDPHFKNEPARINWTQVIQSFRSDSFISFDSHIWISRRHFSPSMPSIFMWTSFQPHLKNAFLSAHLSINIVWHVRTHLPRLMVLCAKY